MWDEMYNNGVHDNNIHIHTYKERKSNIGVLALSNQCVTRFSKGAATGETQSGYKADHVSCLHNLWDEGYVLLTFTVSYSITFVHICYKSCF